MDSIGIGPIPTEAFVKAETRRFTGDWLDTDESERLLRYQKRGIDELKTDFARNLGWVVPLMRLLRPLLTWGMLRGSPYLAQNRRAGRA
jgi:hypothetical protein